MKNISHRINPKPVPGLYFVSFANWCYEQYSAFVVVACSAEEADMLTPDRDMNRHIGIGLGYDLPEVNPAILGLYRDECGTGKSIRRIGDAWVELEWGDVLIASFYSW
jgi:hypothetical protein